MKHLLFLFSILFPLFTYSQQPVRVKVTKPGTLSTLLTEAQKDTCQYLVVSGKLNSADIKVLRRMAGASGRGSLHTLNMNDATIASSEEPYLTIRNAEEIIKPKISDENVSVLKIHRGGGYTMGTITHVNYILSNPNNQKDNSFDSEAITTHNKSVWQKVTRHKLKAKGHQISKDKNGHYTYSAYTRKGLFCEDMFYECPNLQLVILPSKGKTYDRVVIDNDPIRYKEVAKVLSFKK